MSSLYADEIHRVKTLLELMGRGAKRSLGQNFLVNSGKIDLIAKEVKDQSPQTVVEIGPGLGALTLRLKDAAPRFVLIEMDRQFAEYWRSQFVKNNSVELIEADALNINWQDLNLQKAVLVSNLPYQIGARVVVDRCVNPAGIEYMVLMFQKEVAKRLTAQPKTEDYSLLTVMAQSFWTVKTFTELGPNDYFPPPKIASRVVTFERKATEIKNPEAFLKFVKLAFSQRRKQLKKTLHAVADEARVLDVFKQLDIAPTARPEELTVDTFRKLFEKISV